MKFLTEKDLEICEENHRLNEIYHQKLNDWEKEFYIDTWRKRNLSDKQMDIRVRINNKLITLLKNKK